MGHDVTRPALVEQTTPTRIRFVVLAAVCVLAIIIYIHRVGFATAAPRLSADLALGDDAISSLMMAFLLAYGAFEVPWGVAVDHFGVRHLLVFLVVGWSLTTAALAFVVPDGLFPPFALLWGLRFVFGLFQAGAFPTLARLLADWVPMQERATAQGIIWTSTRLGGFLAPQLLVPLFAFLGNWRLALVAVSLLGFAWCVPFWLWFRNRPEDMPQVNDAERAVILGGRRPVAGHSGIPWGAILRCRSVWALCAMYGCGGFAANFFVTMLPSYLQKQRALPEETMKWLSGLPLAFGIVACLLGGVASDLFIRRTGNRRWGRRITGCIGPILAGTSFLLTTQVTETWALGLLLCLTFFGNDLSMGPAWASVADVGERYAGTIGGAMNMIGNLAGAVGVRIAGGLFARGQPDLVFLIFACSFWLGSLCWLAVDVTRPVVTREKP
jgi:sugar phosphate permease